MADVVAVADVCELQSAQSAEAFFKREEIRERLTGMKTIGQRIYYRDTPVRGEFIERLLGKNARDDSVHHALQIFCHIANRFALAEPRGSVIKKNGAAAQTRNADFESYARAERGFLEDHREKLTFERASIAVGPRLNIGCQMEKLAYLRGAPFHAGQKV